MKRRFLSWFASAVMLCGAAALFAYQPSTRTAANASSVTAGNAATIPMPTRLHRIVLQIFPAEQMQTGQEVTLAELLQGMARDPHTQAWWRAEAARKGWTAQTRMKVAVRKYQLEAGTPIKEAPAGWDWQKAFEASDDEEGGVCWCCKRDCSDDTIGGTSRTGCGDCPRPN